jgi:protein SCO1/2
MSRLVGRNLAALALLLFASVPTWSHQGSHSDASTALQASAKATEVSSSKTVRDGGSRWGADYFPNVPLVTHEGKSVRFFDDLIENKVVLINFIYTSCEDSCPLETARLANVQKILGDRVGRDVFMYSITVDPDTDTPEVLKQYAEKFNIGPGWLFLTGEYGDLVLLRKKLGLYIADLRQDLNDHNTSIIMGNQATGRWMKRSPFENPYFLAEQLGSWLSNWKRPAANQASYADAPKLRKISRGENLFRTRCIACHTIGEGDIVDSASRQVGPDLLGVTWRRERAWLTRWLAEPQKMLAEKDPIIMGLLAEYGNVTMPNMHLNEIDVTSLLEYLETESRRVERTRSAAALPAPIQQQN